MHNIEKQSVYLYVCKIKINAFIIYHGKNMKRLRIIHAALKSIMYIVNNFKSFFKFLILKLKSLINFSFLNK